jgi:hypothetical protein
VASNNWEESIMASNIKNLRAPFKQMLENYLLTKENLPADFASRHWDVFPKDYEKTILSTDAWEVFLRNAISIGFNDELSMLENQRWDKNSNGNDVWEMRRKHNYKTLKNSVEDRAKVIELFEILGSICSFEFVLKSIGSSIGSPIVEPIIVDLPENSFDFATGKNVTKSKKHFISCNNFDLSTIYFFWQISRIVDELIGSDRPIVAEIGPGYGLLISKIKKKYPRSRCVLFDLPEMCAVQAYYLSCEFPKAKILYYKDLIEVGNSLFEEEFDFLILPGQIIKSMPKNYADVFINMRSMMEMDQETIKYYFDHIQRTMKIQGIFACFNRYFKNNSDKPSILKYYPFDKRWSILLSQSSILQPHIHDLILRRDVEENPLPVSQALKSLPPF